MALKSDRSIKTVLSGDLKSLFPVHPAPAFGCRVMFEGISHQGNLTGFCKNFPFLKELRKNFSNRSV